MQSNAAVDSHQKLVARIVGDGIHKLSLITSPFSDTLAVNVAVYPSVVIDSDIT